MNDGVRNVEFLYRLVIFCANTQTTSPGRVHGLQPTPSLLACGTFFGVFIPKKQGGFVLFLFSGDGANNSAAHSFALGKP